MAKASDNVFPRVIQGMNTADQAAPSDSSWRVYAKANGIFARSSNTVVGPFGTAGSSDLAGKELDYVEYTSPVSVTATAEASANTVVTGSAVSYDGSTIVMIEFFAPYARPRIDGAANDFMGIWLYDGSSSIGQIGFLRLPANGGTANDSKPVHLMRRLTPSNASHTYSIRATVNSGTGSVAGGAGGSGNDMPGFIRITRVSS